MNNLEGAINYVTRKTGEEIEKVIPNLELSGIGGSMKDNVVNHEKLVFKHKGKMSEDEGALLLVKVVSIYLKNIHSEKRMSEYLKNHPFTYKNLQIIFIVYNEEGDEVYHPDLGFINLIEGEIIYESVKKTENEIYKVETLKEEPYEDAAKRLGVWKNQ